MSAPQQDSSSPGKSRQRANTTSFAPFGWRRYKSDQPFLPHGQPPATTQQQLSINDLIEALRPPAVPRLAHARALSNLLPTASPLPRTSVINLIVSSLCDINGPSSFQAAGFDLVSSYWENPEVSVVETADRFSFLSLFLEHSISWSAELWEPKFKALRSFTKYGIDIVGIEDVLVNVIKWWIEGAFEGILRSDGSLDYTERLERERSVDVLVKFLSDVLSKPENVARLPEDTIPSVLQFYASIVDRSLVLPKPSNSLKEFSASTDSLVLTSQPKFGLHRRTPSTLSTTSIVSPNTPVPSIPHSPYTQPTEIAISIYLDYLHAQIKVLSPPIIQNVLPLLFRALAFCSSPLPRLTALSQSRKKSSLEERVNETLISMYTGPYSTTCMAVNKRSLYPEFPADGESPPHFDMSNHLNEGSTVRRASISRTSLQLGIFTSIGAHRMLRNQIRQVLTARLVRTYILREASTSYSCSGALSHTDVEEKMMEKAWPRDDHAHAGIGIGTGGSSGWDARRLRPAFAESISRWIAWIGEGPHIEAHPASDTYQESWDYERQKADVILEEAAGLLKDILQEVDSREEENNGLNDEEAAFVGEALYSLCKYIPPLRRVQSSGIVLSLFDPLQKFRRNAIHRTSGQSFKRPNQASRIHHLVACPRSHD